MRIVLDMQGAQSESRFRGIGRYTMSFSQAIARNARDHEIWLVLNAALSESIEDIRHAFADLIPQERIRVFDIPGPVAENNSANAWRARAAEMIREEFIRHLKPDVVLINSLFEGFIDNSVTSIGVFRPQIKTAVILYDLIPLLEPNFHLTEPGQNQYYDRKIQSLKKADLLLAISSYSRQEALDVLGLNPERVVAISSAADSRFKPKKLSEKEAADIRKRLGITRKIVSCAVGGFDPRKNLEGLMAAYTLLPPNLRADHQLVIASKADSSTREHIEYLRKRAGLAAGEIVVTGYVSDEDLVTLYSESALFVFPSLREGFGLPALEAMSCGAPVIGSNRTSIPEVIGLSEALFDPSSPQSIADKMARVLTDDAFRSRLCAHGLNQAKKFSWDESAKRAFRALEALETGKTGTLKTQSVSESDLTRALAEVRTPIAPSANDLIRTAECIAFNQGSRVQRQLLIDISELVRHDAKTGIQRVVRSLLWEFLKNPPMNINVRPIYFDGKCYRYADAFVSRFIGECAVQRPDAPIDFCQDDIYLCPQWSTVKGERSFHAQLRRKGLQLFFIIYDILPLRNSDWWPENIAPLLYEWLQSVSNTATKFIAISEATASDLRLWFAEHSSMCPVIPAVEVFHLGSDIENSVPTEGMPTDAVGVLDNLNKKSSFLMVGTIEPRKGHAQAIAAFEKLWKEGVDANLVIIGKKGWMVDSLIENIRRHKELGKRLFWLEGISDEYLEKVYASSACLIAASLGEGFGLPLIEVARHKLPIIARDIPVFREVAGEHAFYFSGPKPEDLAQSVRTWLALNAKAQAPKSERMPRLTWRESVSQLKKIMGLTERKVEADAAVKINSAEPLFRGSPLRNDGVKTAAPSILFPTQKMKILVVKLDHMGDLLLAIPALMRLSDKFHNPEIDIILGEWNVSLAEKIGIFKNVYIFNFFKKESFKQPSSNSDEERKLLASLGAYDIAIDLRRHPDTRFLLKKMKAKLKVGYETFSQDDSVLDICLDANKDEPGVKKKRISISNQMLRLVDAIPAEMIRAPQWRKSSGFANQIAIFPRAGHSAKEWPISFFSDLSRKLIEGKIVGEVCVYVSAGEVFAREYFAAIPGVRFFSGLPIDELFRLVSQSRLVVANDSFGAHLASFLRVPLVAVYGGQDAVEEWGPILGNNTVIYSDVSCSPCHIPKVSDCPFDLICLKQITPEYVLGEIKKKLAEKTESRDVESYLYMQDESFREKLLTDHADAGIIRASENHAKAPSALLGR